MIMSDRQLHSNLDDAERLIVIENISPDVDYRIRPEGDVVFLLDWEEAGVVIPWEPGDPPKEAILRWAREHMNGDAQLIDNSTESSSAPVQFDEDGKPVLSTMTFKDVEPVEEATEEEPLTPEAHICRFNRPVGSPCKVEGCEKVRVKEYKQRGA